MPKKKYRRTSRSGRVPVLMLKVARLLAGCDGWEKGINIDEIARQVYGVATPHTKQKARLLIASVRRTFNVDIFSIKPVGKTEQRYFHLLTESEYTKTIDDFIKHIAGSEKTKKQLEKAKLLVKAKRKLKAVRKVREKQ